MTGAGRVPQQGPFGIPASGSLCDTSIQYGSAESADSKRGKSMTPSYDPIIPRARIGFIIPSSNRMVEPQMQQFLPAGVIPHFARIGMTNRHKAPLDQMLPRITHAAELLADAKCDVVV